jgi:hypothetical protein
MSPGAGAPFLQTPKEGFMRHVSAGKYAFSYFACCLLLFLATSFYPGQSEAASGTIFRTGYGVKLVPADAKWRMMTGSTKLPMAEITWEKLKTILRSRHGEHPAPFGNITAHDPQATLVGLLPATEWKPATVLFLERVLMIPDKDAIAALQLNVTAHSGFIFYVNGVEVARRYSDEFKGEDSGVSWKREINWEYSLPIDPSVLNQGRNELAICALAKSGKTYFDMELAARKK